MSDMMAAILMDRPIYQKMSNRLGAWWCVTHGRVADHIRLSQAGVTVVCRGSGIMIPCQCEFCEMRDGNKDYR